MALALFDLDDTLLVGNSETEWFHYLAEKGYIGPIQYRAKMAEFDRQYAAGASHIDDYIHYVLQTLTGYSQETLLNRQSEWLTSKVIPMIAKGTSDLLKSHRDAGDTLVIISASTTFCVEPIANLLEVDHFIATRPEILDGRYTGRFIAPTCFAEGKITLLERWLSQNGLNLKGSHFYSDSRNDIPLLEQAEFPIAVDADPHLQQEAIKRDWQSMSLR